MDKDGYAAHAASVQSEIFRVKLANLEIKRQIEIERGQGLRVGLELEQSKTQEKRIRLDIQRVHVGIAQDDLSGITTQRQLGQQRWAIQLDGEARELPLLRESIEARLQGMQERNLRSLLGSDD